MSIFKDKSHSIIEFTAGGTVRRCTISTARNVCDW